jgi:hypothetical protein
MKITKATTLEKIMAIKNGEEILHKNNVPCVSCPMAPMELSTLKIGDVCKMYGLKLEKILKELNKK